MTGFSQGASSGQIDFNKLTGTGDMGQTILASVPDAFRAQVQPFVGNIVDGIHRAFSLGVASTFIIGVVAAILAAVAAAAMQELALRQQTPAQAQAAAASNEPRRPALPAAD